MFNLKAELAAAREAVGLYRLIESTGARIAAQNGVPADAAPYRTLCGDAGLDWELFELIRSTHRQYLLDTMRPRQ